MPRLERRGVDERLEDRAGLAARLVHAVELAVLEVAAAHPGADVAGLRLEGEHQALEVGRDGGRIGVVIAPLEVLGVGAMGKLAVAWSAGLDGASSWASSARSAASCMSRSSVV